MYGGSYPDLFPILLELVMTGGKVSDGVDTINDHGFRI